MIRFVKSMISVSVLATMAATASAEVRIQGAGATFPEPLYKLWIAEYQKVNPGVQIDYQGIGSGGGIKGITDKTIDFAGSDAPMSKKELDAAGGADNIVEVPSCAGGVVPAYNVPGVKEDLNFTGELIADIYMGKVNNWNDPRIAKLNPSAKLPDLAITPAWRTDGSGTNYVFTNYLSTQSAEFKRSIGSGKQVKWPIGSGGKGNAGVAAVIAQTQGGFGYLEQNYADKFKIAYGAVQNTAGKFVKASPQSVSAAGEGAAKELKGHILAANLWNQPGEEAYPIASFTYLIVYKDLKNLKSKEQAAALTQFMDWATHDGQKAAPEQDYAPLSPAVQAKVEAALKEISYGAAAASQ